LQAAMAMFQERLGDLARSKDAALQVSLGDETRGGDSP